LKMSEEYIPKKIKSGKLSFSGADMEAALTRAKFQAAAQQLSEVTPEIIDNVLDDFLPPTYPDEVELQTLSAVLECTSKKLLPEKYQKMDRGEILTHIENLKSKAGSLA